MKLVSKIAVAQVIGKVPCQEANAADAQGNIVKVMRGIEQGLMRITGIATGVKKGNSTFGEWVAFIGQFQAINILTGEVFRSGKLHLPAIATELMLSVVENSDGKTGVEFAFDIGAKPANTPHGYEYTIIPLIAPADNDPLTALTARLTANAPALPAPKVQAQETQVEDEKQEPAKKSSKK